MNKMKNHIVILFNLGGPDALSAVEPFLFNLFSDHDIFKIPFGQNLFAGIMSRFRAPKVSKRYRQIGGKSPINELTELQRSMLEHELVKTVPHIKVYTAMRYWHPTIRETAEKIADSPVDKIILLPLYPHYSITTTGSSFNEWKRVYRQDPEKLVYINDYFDNPKYILAVNEKIDEALQRFPERVQDDIQIVFSAHGIPESLVKKGDPYIKQIEETVRCVMKGRDFSHDYHLCFQSKVGPAKWVGPSTDQMIESLAEKEKKQLLIVPVSFVSDHIETLFELDVEYREVAEKANIDNYIVVKGLNDSKTFIGALKDLVLEAFHIEDAAAVTPEKT